ncbi:PAS domain S-box protein [Haloferax sp. DFSO60]|uniref:PAS domain-containing sensor histidine kinase n=1 Tax=Haloferax sp. DFSO60 TaxID=3388652 RepID=UPI00397C7751
MDQTGGNASLPPELSDRFSYEQLVEGAPFGVFVFDQSGTIVYANGAAGTVLGYDPSRLVGTSLTALLPDDRADEYLSFFQAYLRGDAERSDWEHTEIVALHNDGHSVPLATTFREVIIDGESRYTGLFQDITEQAMLREELRASLDAVHELYQISSNGSLSFAEKCDRILTLAREYLGVSYGFVSRITEDRQEIVAATGEHPRLQPGESCPLEHTYCRKIVDTTGLLAVHHATEERWENDPAYDRLNLETYLGSKLVVNNELYGTLCFGSSTPHQRPVSDSERTFVELASRWMAYELERRDNQIVLEQQNKRLNQFASTVAHDLRNPLNVVNGRLKLARESHEDDENLERAMASLEKAFDRIDEMLHFAKMGQVGKSEPVSLQEVALEAWETVYTDESMLVFEDELGIIFADRSRLSRLFENLFRNSLEHGSSADHDTSLGESGLTVRIGSLDVQSGFYIEDNGVGFSTVDHDQLFQYGCTGSPTGNGFGLAIAHEIAIGHGWTIRPMDAESGGARFEFSGVELT